VLSAEIIRAGTHTQADYAAASWNRMQSALTAAVNMYNSVDATQTQVNSSANSLRSAINSLVEAPPSVVIPGINREAINGEIVRAGTHTQADYTPASWNRMQSALTAAVNMYNNASATQTQVNSSANSLRSAINSLRLA